ncbi:MAG: hypothetical protein HWD60_03670 [Defluviicoccus sp.]|nr:MAG: hypothetical protein HWD60_03670 [Defluviicoccus sp.]
MQDPVNPIMHKLGNHTFLTGLGVGAVVTLLVSNPGVQRAVFRTVARTTNAITSGLAEARSASMTRRRKFTTRARRKKKRKNSPERRKSLGSLFHDSRCCGLVAPC